MKIMNTSLLLILLASPASGMVYSWIDSSGIAHYTNKDYEIPVRYRAKVKARYPEQGDSGTPQREGIVPQLKPENQPTKPAQQKIPETQVTSVQPVAVRALQGISKKQSVKQRRQNRIGSDEE
jgi:hypothetical protein